MARKNKQTRFKRVGGLHTLGQHDWAERGRRLRRWMTEHQNVAVYRTADGWTLVIPSVYLDAGLLGAFRFSEQRTIAESILRL